MSSTYHNVSLKNHVQNQIILFVKSPLKISSHRNAQIYIAEKQKVLFFDKVQAFFQYFSNFCRLKKCPICLI